MKDRYLFRGKRSDNFKKNWVVGHYVSVPRAMIVLAELFQNGNWNVFDINPDTIGQCTGFRDKNGTLIWEGDIVKLIAPVATAISEVFWSDNRWCIKWSKHHAATGMNGFDERYCTFEVIGNVHDNPDLNL